MMELSQFCVILFSIAIAVVILYILLHRCSKKLQGSRSNHFRADRYKISSSPNVWVFDDLLSEELLDYVDTEFERKSFADEYGSTRFNSSQTRRVLQLDLNSRTQEFNQVIEKIGNFIPHETCNCFLVCDVKGEDQFAHMDHIELDALAPEYQKLDYIDRSALQEGKSRVHSAPGFCSNGDGRFVPTFSIVVYFNDVGSCNFPRADLNVKGKRGRIIMFQNYSNDEERPRADGMALHQGLYEDGKFKRVMTMGILSNQNVDLNKPPETKGILYVPGPRGPKDIAHHHDPNPATYDMEHKPSRPQPRTARRPEAAFGVGTLLEFKQSRTIEACIYKKQYNQIKGEWTYRLRYSTNFSNRHYFLHNTDVMNAEWIPEAALRERDLCSRACGKAEEEIITYIALTSLLSLDPSEARGWICKCHLCKGTFSARKTELEHLLPEVKQILPSCQSPAPAQRVKQTSKKKKTIKIDGTYKNSSTAKLFKLSQKGNKGSCNGLWSFTIKGRTIQVDGKSVSGKVLKDGSIRWSNGKHWTKTDTEIYE